ncbi:MAG: FG-GAP repeat domain-containing protein [Phycisphaerae bacterium]
MSKKASALINVDFTPVDLYHRAEVIATTRVSTTDERGRIQLSDVTAIKGEPPQPLEIRVDTAEKRLVRELRGAIGSDTPSDAVLLWGDFSAAAMSGRQVESPAAMMHVGTTWVALYRQADNRYEIRTGPTGRADPLDLKTVWAGSSAMLRECLEYVAADPRAEVPAVSGVMWEDVEIVDELAAPAAAMLVADILGGKPHLLVGTPAGDRLYEIDDGSLRDVTDEAKLESRSDLLTVGDFDGDGLVDIASWNAESGELTILLQDSRSAFRAEASAELAGGVESLSCAYAGPDSPAAVIAGIGGAPVRAILADGKLKVAPIVDSSPAGEASGPCVVADFDDDGLPDVFQPTPEGALLYGGAEDGSYAQPKKVTDSGWSGLSGAATGDFDADGKLDVLLSGSGDVVLLTNEGGTFSDRTDETGELDYIARPGVAGIALGDINNDGRQDTVLLYPQARPHVYFNRGFRCFGYAGDLEESLDYVDYEALDELESGQSAGVLADFTGSGGTDLAVSTVGGKLLLLRREDGPTLSLTVTLSAQSPGPATVRAVDGGRHLGARLLVPAQTVLFGKTAKGPLDVTWRLPGGDEQSRREVIVKPSRLVLPPEGGQ